MIHLFPMHNVYIELFFLPMLDVRRSLLNIFYFDHMLYDSLTTLWKLILIILMLIEYLLSFDNAFAYITLIFGFSPSIFFAYDKKGERDRYSKAIFELIMLIWVKWVVESYLSIFVFNLDYIILILFYNTHIVRETIDVFIDMFNTYFKGEAFL